MCSGFLLGRWNKLGASLLGFLKKLDLNICQQDCVHQVAVSIIRHNSVSDKRLVLIKLRDLCVG